MGREERLRQLFSFRSKHNLSRRSNSGFFALEEPVLRPQDEANALDFVIDYLIERDVPFSFRLPEGGRSFQSNVHVLQGKGAMLFKLLSGNPHMTSKEYTFAKSTLAEIIAKDMLTKIFSEQTRDTWEVSYAPTQADDTSHADPKTQRGGDIIISREEQKGVVPLMLIDITTSRLGIASKFKNPSGINLLLGAPVVVLPMGNVLFSEDKSTRNIHGYLENVVVDAIRSKTYEPFYGIDYNNKKRIIDFLISQLDHSSRALRNRLTENPLDAERYQKFVEKIDFFRSITRPSSI